MPFRKLIPAMIALLLLSGAPLQSLPSCGSAPRGGLICYCCKEAGKPCSLLCCAPCQMKAGVDAPRASFEMILPVLSDVNPGPDIPAETVFLPPHAVVYLEVPVRPPIPA